MTTMKRECFSRSISAITVVDVERQPHDRERALHISFLIMFDKYFVVLFFQNLHSHNKILVSLISIQGNASSVDVPIPEEWEQDRCPEAFMAGAEYGEGHAVSVAKGHYQQVYTCMAYPMSQHCSGSGYEPGTSLYSAHAWVEGGSCSGR